MAHPLSFNLPTEPKGIEYLIELALDLRGTWEHSADELWGQLDPELWRLTLNPWAVLQTVSHARLKTLAADPKFRQKAAALVRARHQYLSAPTWFKRRHADPPLTGVAYFSMEFMLSEALPIYSGGLGNVAGDQLKSASDLGVPVIGVGLLYQQGYFRQVLDGQGAQRALYPYNDPGQLPITPVRDPDGEWVRLEVALPGFKAWVRAWQVQGWPRHPLPVRHERPRESSDPAGHHQRALRRWPGAAPAPGDRAWHRRLAPAANPRAAARGLSAQ
jgi:glycogen phosphorylase